MSFEHMVPAYWKRASRELAKRDPKMAEFVQRYSGVSLTSRGDPFTTLARSIVGQQISVKAADSVWQRFVSTVKEVTPASVSRKKIETLRKCGLSVRKAEYLKDLAAHFEQGLIHVERWSSMSDDEVIGELTAVRGIGVWTAEMFLIFHEMRPNIFPLDDLGLQKAIALHYFSGNRPCRKEMIALGEQWRPWRSVATWYLWRSLDPVVVEY